MQSKWIQLLHSRTFGVLVLMFLTDAVSAFGAHIQPDLLILINLALTSLASYLHINPNEIRTPVGTSVTSVTQTSPTTATATITTAPVVPVVTP